MFLKTAGIENGIKPLTFVRVFITQYLRRSIMLIKVVGTKSTTVIFMGDIWKPGMQQDSRYLWMLLEIGEGKLWLGEPKPWILNINTGEWQFIEPVQLNQI